MKRLLKQLLPGDPSTHKRLLRSWEPANPFAVAITTVPSSSEDWRLRIERSIERWPWPYFLPVFCVPKSAEWPRDEQPFLLRYPDALAGNIHAIRTYLERRHIFDILSDDDPGAQIKGVYRPMSAKVLLPCSYNLTGSHSRSARPRESHFLWHILFELGRLANAVYVAPNTSAQSFKVNGQRSHDFSASPIHINVALTGVVGLVEKTGVRERTGGGIYQEYSEASAQAVSERTVGTLRLMSFRCLYHVNPPDAEKSRTDVATLAKRYPAVAPFGGKYSRTCIVRFATKKAVTLRELYANC